MRFGIGCLKSTVEFSGILCSVIPCSFHPVPALLPVGDREVFILLLRYCGLRLQFSVNLKLLPVHYSIQYSVQYSIQYSV